MLPQRVGEERHHTDEQVSEYLASALAICEAHDLEPSTRDAVLPQLLVLVSSKQIWHAQPQPLQMPVDLNSLRGH